jgi:hypothetical protein
MHEKNVDIHMYNTRFVDRDFEGNSINSPSPSTFGMAMRNAEGDGLSSSRPTQSVVSV